MSVRVRRRATRAFEAGLDVCVTLCGSGTGLVCERRCEGCHLVSRLLPDSFNIAREFIRSGDDRRSDKSWAYLLSNEAFRADCGLAAEDCCLSLQVKSGDQCIFSRLILHLYEMMRVPLQLAGAC